jgi:hypothetical protein
LIALLADRLLHEDLPAARREEAEAHLASCRGCGAEFEAALARRAVLRELAAAPVPARLSARLRVMASHERARQLARITWRARLHALRERAILEFENMMKPVALPIAGGLVSAMFMFGVLIPSVSYARIKTVEPPSAVFTEPSGHVVGEGEFPRLRSANQPSVDGRIVVLLIIDDQGRVLNYRVTHGIITPEVENFILFSKFTPATVFGIPTWGEVQAVFGAKNGGHDRRS